MCSLTNSRKPQPDIGSPPGTKRLTMTGDNRLFRPHVAREHTVLFPALHQIVPAKRLQELGEQFEKAKDRLFGEEGFEKTVEQVAEIEKQLGIGDLAKVTAK